jgi:hypothetical protein
VSLRPKRKRTGVKAVGSSDVLGLMVESARSLRQLRRLCEDTARAGKLVRGLTAYKNALATELAIGTLLEKTSQVRRDFDTSPQTNKVTKPFIFWVVINTGNRKQFGTRTHCAHGVFM